MDNTQNQPRFCLSDLTVGLAADAKPKNVCVVKLTTTTWADKRGLHIKKSLAYLRRKCAGYNAIEEEVSATGADDTARIILNLDECEDGVYEVVVCNETHDWESGHIDSYDLKLIPFAAANVRAKRGQTAPHNLGET